MHTKFPVILLLIFGYCLPLQSQEIVNGSFEDNSVTGCGINLTNSLFTSKMNQVVAFGGQTELDILSDSCGYIPPPTGDFFVAANFQRNVSDAFSFTLSAPLRKDTTYFIRFAAKLSSDTFDLSSRVELGLSQLPGEFGTVAGLSEKMITQWTYYEVKVVPAENSSYLTVRINAARHAWVWLDDFSVVCPVIDLGNDSTYCVISQVPLAVKAIFETYLWSTGEKSPKIAVDQPGTYFVEAKAGACLVRDTIVLREYEHRCDCQVFLPNAFTPNLDGLNEVFSAVSECDFTDYYLEIYNRWGNRVYESSNPQFGWDGRNSLGEAMPEGAYAYRLRYRFFFDKRVEWQTGSITLYR